jgi:predicted nucleic acid-binding protein
MALPPSAPHPAGLHKLDAGESEAIRLAMAVSADYVLIDEKEGRRCAFALGIRAVGLLGILIRAKQSGAVESMRLEIDKLRRHAGFFVGSDLEARVLAMVDE